MFDEMDKIFLRQKEFFSHNKENTNFDCTAKELALMIRQKRAYSEHDHAETWYADEENAREQEIINQIQEENYHRR